MKKKSIFLLLMFALLLFLPINSHAAKLSKKSVTMVPYQSYQLKLKGTKKTVTWASSDTNVVTVTKKGKLKAKNYGSAVIYASQGGKTYACKVSVIIPSISNIKEMKKGNSSYIGIGNKKSFSKITYKSSNKSIATVTSGGKVKAKKAGSCYIKVTFNKAYSVRVHVMVNCVTTTSVVNVMRGSSKKLTPTYASAGTSSYSVSNPSLGYVVNGTYYSTSYGLNTVTYTCGNYKHTFSVRNYCWEAHRGYHDVYPENTLEAIRAAKAAGASAVEIDVRPTRDGHFVLSHNMNLKSTTNGLKPNNVQSYKLASLTSTDIIYKNGKYYHMPTLEEALTLARQLGLNVAVEMKDLPSTEKYSYFTISKEELTKTLVNTIRAYGDGGTSIIVTTEENAQLLASYSGGFIPVRITNDSYSSNANLRNIAAQYSFIMSTNSYASIHYGGYIQTVDYPF